MKSKGQVTIFVILGLIVLLVVVFLMFSLGKKKDTNVTVDASKSFNSLELYVHTCMESAAKAAVLKSFNDGFYSSGEGLSYNHYYLYSGEDSELIYETRMRPKYKVNTPNTLPSLSDSEIHISNTFLPLVRICLEENDLSVQFNEYSVGSVVSSVKINERDVLFSINADINAVSNGVKLNVNSFSYLMQYDVKKKILVVNDFLDKQLRSEEILVGYLSNSALNNDYSFLVMNAGQSVYMYELVFKDAKELLGDNLVYGFSLEYDWGDSVIPIWNEITPPSFNLPDFGELFN